MEIRCPGATAIGTAAIRDYQLMFKGSKTGSYLTIEQSKGASVPVGVWQVDHTHEQSLDVYEGYPSFYYKVEMPIMCIDFSGQARKLKAFVYIMDERRHLALPSDAYVRTCSQGYRDFGLDLSKLKEAYKISLKGSHCEI